MFWGCLSEVISLCERVLTQLSGKRVKSWFPINSMLLFGLGLMSSGVFGMTFTLTSSVVTTSTYYIFVPTFNLPDNQGISYLDAKDLSKVTDYRWQPG